MPVYDPQELEQQAQQKRRAVVRRRHHGRSFEDTQRRFEGDMGRVSQPLRLNTGMWYWCWGWLPRKMRNALLGPFGSEDEAQSQGQRAFGSLSFEVVSLPTKDPTAAAKSIQLITGVLPPASLLLDMGIMDIEITRPSRRAGKPGAIRFKRDVKQKTYGDITLKGVRVKEGVVA